jgi:hypothetical protein
MMNCCDVGDPGNCNVGNRVNRCVFGELMNCCVDGGYLMNYCDGVGDLVNSCEGVGDLVNRCVVD